MHVYACFSSSFVTCGSLLIYQCFVWVSWYPWYMHILLCEWRMIRRHRSRKTTLQLRRVNNNPSNMLNNWQGINFIIPIDANETNKPSMVSMIFPCCPKSIVTHRKVTSTFLEVGEQLKNTLNLPVFISNQPTPPWRKPLSEIRVCIAGLIKFIKGNQWLISP